MLNAIPLAKADLNLLVVFHAVLEERHVARAAARLNLTPSAVSHGIARLRGLLNDPLFLKTPRGVVPTTRAIELAEPVADILARVGTVIARAVPFDPATSGRRFVIGAPDGVVASVLSPLMARVGADAPNVGIGLIHLMPSGRSAAADQAWEESLRKLEKREIDIGLLPVRTAPPRFSTRRLYDEDFVVAMRKGHPFARAPSEGRFCSARHLLVSLSGEPYGFIDESLAKRGLERRVVLTVPTFMLALAHLAESDLIATLPRRLVERHAGAFGLTFVELPFKRKPDPIRAIATKAAMMDAGVAWLMDILVASVSVRSSDAVA